MGGIARGLACTPQRSGPDSRRFGRDSPSTHRPVRAQGLDGEHVRATLIHSSNPALFLFLVLLSAAGVRRSTLCTQRPHDRNA
jgi:hypothetical protein